MSENLKESMGTKPEIEQKSKSTAYHMWFETEKDVKEFCERENAKPKSEKPWGQDYYPEFHKAQCEHASGGWYAVNRNEYGHMWTGAPWESQSCEHDQSS